MKIVGVFLLFIGMSFLVFFYYVQEDVEKNIRKTLTDDIERQSDHLNSIIMEQYQQLRGMAAYFGGQEELVTSSNLSLLRAINEESNLGRLAVIGADGVSYYDDGSVRVVSNRDYFTEALTGKEYLSDPLESLVDGQTKVILSVPVYRNDEVVGVVAGSYDVGMLSHILFEDVYDGAGYSLIVTGEGTIVAYDGSEQFRMIQPNDNFFEFYQQAEFGGDVSIADIRQDFDRQSGNTHHFTIFGDRRYLSYTSLNLNDWMLCYIVPYATAQEGYKFISNYETLLIGSCTIATLLLFLAFMRMNHRRQSGLLYEAQMDALTGVYNKKSTEVQMTQWLADNSRYGCQAFLMMDIDKFKEINDQHGHVIGDLVLQMVGQVLRQHFREGDIIGRIGGDEFAVLMKNVSAPEHARYKAEALCALIRSLHVEACPELHLTASIGISFGPECGSTFLELYQNADRALYMMKQCGRDGCICCRKNAEGEIVHE